MEQLFGEPLFYVFFIYGLSFMIMAYVVIDKITKASQLTLVSSFYALCFFGLTHGTAELTDWVRFMMKILGVSQMSFFTYLSQISVILSFVLLLQFGINLLSYKSEKRTFFRLLPVGLFAVFLVAVIALGVGDILKIGLLARYSFGFVGSLISAVALFRLAQTLKVIGSRKLVVGLTVTAVAFALYAVFGGLIIDPIAGIPIQIFRAACAVTIAISSFSALDVFIV